MRVLLVEDDELIAQGIVQGLKQKGYQVEHCTTGRQAEVAFDTDHFEAAIFDLGLPDGLAVPLIKRLKSRGLSVPILVLTAWDDIDTKLAALDAGADDFVTKPFDLREIEARLRVITRRQQQRTDDILSAGPVQMDLANQSVCYQQQSIILTKREWLLLKEFMLHPQRILGREHLESVCFGWDSEVESNAIEVHIHNLRKKFYKELIRNVRGVGYRLDPNIQQLDQS